MLELAENSTQEEYKKEQMKKKLESVKEKRLNKF